MLGTEPISECFSHFVYEPLSQWSTLCYHNGLVECAVIKISVGIVIPSMLQCIYLETRGDYGKLADYQKTALEKDEQNDTLFKRQVHRQSMASLP